MECMIQQDIHPLMGGALGARTCVSAYQLTDSLLWDQLITYKR